MDNGQQTARQRAGLPSSHPLGRPAGTLAKDPPGLIARLLKLRNRGLSLRAIEAETGVGKGVIARIAKRYMIDRQGRVLAEAEPLRREQT